MSLTVSKNIMPGMNKLPVAQRAKILSMLCEGRQCAPSHGWRT